MKRLFYITILAITILFCSCQTAKEEFTDFRFPKSTTMDGTVFWIDLENDPLDLSATIASALENRGFEVRLVSGIDKIQDYDDIATVRTGTAFSVSANMLVTNSHVVGNAEKVKVLYDGKFVDADIVLNEADIDIAVLKLDDIEFPYAFDIGKVPEKGSDISVMGYPLPEVMGHECKLTNGIINAVSGLDDTVTKMQISAEIQPGNSGGPVFTDDFTVVGVATEKLSDFYAMYNVGTIPQTVNYAIKGEVLDFVLKDLITENSNAEKVDNLEKAEQAVFLVESGNDNLIYDDILINISYVYDFLPESIGLFTTWPEDSYFVESMVVSLFDSSGNELGKLTESSYAGEETAYETADYIADIIFYNWAYQCLPQTNSGVLLKSDTYK